MLSRILLISLLFASAVQADTKTFVPSTGEWNDDDAWSPSGKPDGDDDVVVSGGKVCTVYSPESAATVSVSGTGSQIVVEEDAVLSLTSDGTSTLDTLDAILLKDDAILGISGDHTFTTSLTPNTGSITGTSAGCEIYIEAGAQMESQVTLLGQMRIVGLTAAGLSNGSFLNDGIVYAVADGGEIRLSATLLADDTSGALRWWAANNCDLVFECPATGLQGDVLVNGGTAGVGTIVCEANVATCGTFHYHEDGCLEVASGKSFKYAAFHSDCDPIHDSGTGGCSNSIFVVSGPHSSCCEP